MTIRLTILRKGLILIAVPLFFQLAFIALVARMRNDGAAAEEWTIHSKDVIAQAQKCRVRLLSAHGAIQGFLLTRDPLFEESLRFAVSKARGEIGEIEKLVQDNPPQVRAASQIRREAEAFLAFMLEGRDLAKEGGMDVSKVAARRLQGQRMLESLEEQFDRFLGVEQDLDVARHKRLSYSWATLDQLLVVGVLLSVFVTVALAILFARNISGRITNLTENAHRLAEGKALTPPIAGGDEIARLDHVFHEMAATLAAAARREHQHARLLERRADELNSVNGQLREKAQENEMFVYSVSHDLRSPLVNLQGFSKELQLIGKDLDSPGRSRRRCRRRSAARPGR